MRTCGALAVVVGVLLSLRTAIHARGRAVWCFIRSLLSWRRCFGRFETDKSKLGKVTELAALEGGAFTLGIILTFCCLSTRRIALRC